MTNGMRRTTDERAEKMLAKMNRQITRRTKMRELKRRILLPFLKLKKPRDIVMAEGYGGSYPACPRCGEYVYYRDMCCFCGQRFSGKVTTVGEVMDRGG